MTEITVQNVGPAPAARPFTAVFLHDWVDVTMIHFAVDPAALAPAVPFKLDTRGGRAFVSLVRFRLQRMRCPVAPRLTRALLRPISDHHFLNLRTCVRHRGEPGIHFLAEWIDNPISAPLGPLVYGLPYRTARFAHGGVETGAGRLIYRAEETAADHAPAVPGTLDVFLLERYAAFTHRRGATGAFRIRHEPWPQRHARVEIVDDSLVRTAAPWFAGAELECAHRSPGVLGVEISRPFRIHDPHRKEAPR